MNIIFYPPPDQLKKFVRYFWSCDHTDHDEQKTIFFDNYADKYPRLVFQMDDRPQLVNHVNQIVPSAYICGIETIPSIATVKANFSHFGVSFNSFALTEIFKTIANQTLNKNIDLKDFGYKALVEKLVDAQSHQQRIEVMCRFILDQTSKKSTVHISIMQMVLANELDDQTDLFKLHNQYGMSERTMERLFKNAMGISPKTYQRLVRFEKTLALLKNPAFNNSGSVGHLLNYTDQSHFIKDFKQFSNLTPLQFQKNNFLLSESSAFISKEES